MSMNSKHKDHLSSYLTRYRAVPQQNDIPGEILMKIFMYLSPQDLILASQVSKTWHSLANDNALWRPIYKKYIGNKSSGSEREVKSRSIEGMKQDCMTRCIQQRNKRVFKHLRKRKSPYTGLQESKEVEQALRTAGMTFELVMIDSDGKEHTLGHQDVFYHAMSVSIRWFALEMTPVNKIKEFCLYSRNPLFYNHATGKPVKNGPYQRSLLLTQDFKWSDSKGRITGGDELISLYSLPHGLTIAMYKGDELELAFVSYGLSLDSLVQRCIHGTPDLPYTISENKCLDPGMSSKHGLLGYQLTVQLRSMRKAHWDEQFRNIDCKDGNMEGGYAIFTVVRPDQRLKISLEDFIYPWKTDAFKGKVKDVAVLDLTMLDEENMVFWTTSSLVKIERNKEISKMFDFDYRYDGITSIEYADNTGKLFLQICKMDTGEFFITNLTVSLSLEAIDDRFGTKYKSPAK
ncbi:F-box only protein 15-like isoform X2 [Ostrea edulis]|uniref:F-box only protein 15-like isoform X2 n=1 Tax=Ostrea edulis TaxID=37623 RepID=UPI002094F76F|nr:F-box only protein 15-like isoform X2 [Ostrea edulis]